MGEYLEALKFYERTLEICHDAPPKPLLLAVVYNSIREVQDNMGQQSEALTFDGRALEIYQQRLPSNHS